MPEATFTAAKSKHQLALEPSKLDHAIAEWEFTPTTGLLGDILSYSVDSKLIPRIVNFLRVDRDVKTAATITQKNFIAQLLDDGHESEVQQPSLRDSLNVCNPVIRQEVATLRQILAINPANPLALLDLAQFQLTSGHTRRAERSVLTALSLSPNSRIALRTLARLYVHQREFDKAHDLISRHARTNFDPWLMATEIALAEVAGTTSRFIRKGAKFAREKMASNAHLSELTGALGGIELQAGNVKRARDMFRFALLDPNDNVLAQAITHQKLLGIELTAPAQRKAILPAHEAQTLLAWNELDTDTAELHALAWHKEEPFSSRPLQFLATIYAAQRDFTSAETLAKRGLIADPKDPALLSNLAYVYASSGKLVQAERALYRLVALKQAKYGGVALATAGLMAMKQGTWAAGDELYEAAMRVFRDQRQFVHEALCCAYYARSAADTGHPQQGEILVRAEALYKQYPSSDAAIVLKMLKPDMKPVFQLEGTRRLSQWIYDSKSESLIQIHGVTEPNAPALIIRD